MNLPHQDLSIEVGNETLEEVSLYTYLGVNLDNRLVFDKFLKEKCNKINVRLHQLRKMRKKKFNNNISYTIYKQTIVPMFDYADFLV